MSSRTATIGLFMLAVGVLGAGTSGAQTYNITTVTAPTGATAVALSQEGWVAGEVRLCCNSYNMWMWRPTTPNGATGVVTEWDAGNNIQMLRPAGVNNNRLAWYYQVVGLSGSFGHVWHFDQNGVGDLQTDIYSCTPPSWDPTYGAHPSAINSNGQVAGNTCGDAAVWNVGGGLPLLSGHPDGNAAAYAINDNGFITGNGNAYMSGLPSCSGSLTTHCSDAYGLAFIAPPGGVMQYLPWISGTAGCTGVGINDVNEVVGTCITHPDNGGGPRAWVYTGGQMVQIGCDALGNCNDANALDINNHSVVVGWISNGVTSNAYVWDQTNGLRDLNAFLPSGSVHLTGALKINDLGQILAYGSDSRIYLLTPVPSADLSIANTAPSSVRFGDAFGYTISVSNAGPDTANGVTITDALPAGATFVSAASSVGSCSGTTTVTCSLGDLSNGAGAMITINVTAAAIGTLSNTATVAAASPVDQKTSDNSSTATTTVNKRTPVVTWSAPGPIAYGTALDGSELDASADVAGTFAYTPAPGTILHAGAGQTLSVTFTPTDAQDYETVTATVALTVNSAPLTITADNKSKTYGADLPALTATYAGFVNGDTAASLTTAPSITSTATAASAVGSYPITAAGAVDADYTIAYAPGSLAVTPVGLTITADSFSKPYGAALPTLTAHYSGFVNGDTASSLTTPPTLTTSATAASHVTGGPYAITASGAVDANYTIAYVAGSLTVTAVPLTITANNQTKVYGAPVPALTVSYAGFTNGDGAASLATAPVVTTTATAGSPVGSYGIAAAGAADTDYTIGYGAGTLTVTPAATVTGVAASANPAAAGQPITLTATVGVIAPGAGSPTGTVTFTSGGTTLGTASVGSGQATLSTASLAVGSDSIVATYSGDGNFGGSASAALDEIVTASHAASIADLIARVGSLPLNAGQQNSLLAKLRAAQASLARGNTTAAANQLGAFINELQALAGSGQLSTAMAGDLIAEAQQVIAAL